MLEMHKPGQGTKARVTSALVGAAFVLFGFYESGGDDAFTAANRVSTIISGVVFLTVCVVVVYLAFYHKRSVDFLIEVQAELRKVAWPSKGEVRGATTVVVSTVVVLSAFLFMVDTIFLQINKLIGVLR